MYCSIKEYLDLNVDNNSDVTNLQARVRDSYRRVYLTTRRTVEHKKDFYFLLLCKLQNVTECNEIKDDRLQIFQLK